MTSNITPSNIDGEFPNAGIDSDSQGFRDNFTASRTNFEAAANEITDLQRTSILKAPLLSEETVDNNCAGTLLKSASIIDFRETIYSHNITSGPITISHINGHYQIIQPTDDIKILFTDFPEDAFGRIRLEVTIHDASFTVELPPEVIIGIGLLPSYNSETRIMSFSEVGTFIIEFTSRNQGVDITVQDLTRIPNLIPVRDILSSTGIPGDVVGTLCASTTGDYLFYCYASYTDGLSKIWNRTALDEIVW